MDKRSVVAKSQQDEAKNQISEQKLVKIKEALKGINWNYDTLFEDLTGFIEGHEENSIRLKNIEAERHQLSTELAKSEQKIQFLNKKINDGQNEISYIKRGYQQRVDELLAIKSELSLKYEALGQKKIQSDEKLKEFVEALRKKEEEITQYKIQLEKSENQIHGLNQSFAEKLGKFKNQMSEKIESKEKLINAKTNRIIAEKEQLQKYVTELMADNNRSSQEIQNLKKGLAETVQVKENLLAQKNLLARKVDEYEKNLKNASSRMLSIESEYKNSVKVNGEKDVYLEQFKKTILEQKNIINKLEQEKTMLNQKINDLDAILVKNKIDIDNYKAIIADLNANQVIVEKLEAIKNQNQAKISQLESETLKLREELSVLSTKNQDLSADVSSKQSMIEQLKTDNLEQFQRFTKTIDEHEVHIERLISQRTELQEALREISLKSNDAGDNFQKLLDEKSKIENQLTEVKNELNIEISTNHNLQDKLTKLIANKNEVDSKLEISIDEISILKEKVIQKAKEVEDLKKSLNLFNETKNNFMNLQKSFDDEKNQNLLLLDKIKSGLNKIDDLEQINQKLLSEKNILESELQETSEQLKDSRQTLIKKNNDIKDLESQVGALKNTEFELNKTLSGLQQELLLMTDESKGSQAKNSELQEKITSLNTNVDQLNLEISDNKLTIQNLENRLESNLEEIEFQKNLVSEGKNTILSLESKLNDLNTKLNTSHDYKQELEDQRDILNSKIEDLKFELSERDQDIIQKQKMIDDVIAERKTINKRNEDLNFELSQLNVNLDALNVNLTEETRKNQILEDDLKVKIVEIENIKSSFKVAKAKIVELEDNVLESRREKDKLQQEVGDLNEQVENLKNTLKQKVAEKEFEIKEKDQEIYNLKIEKQKVLENEIVLSSKIKNNLLQIEELEFKNDDLNIKIESLQAEIVENKSAIESKVQNENVLNEKIKSLEVQVADFGFKVVKASEKFDEVYTQKQILEQQAEENKVLYDQVKRKSQELEVSMQSLTKREEQLSLYSRWVDAQKEGVQKQVLKLVSELKTTKELNPLNPYLKITEREISKIEVLMTKSNVFGPQRAQLESQYEQLVKQRDEVRELLNKTNIDVDLKAQVLLSVLKSSEFIPVPPLPPGKVIESETEIII